MGHALPAVPHPGFMKIIRTPRAMAAWSERLRREGVTIGFVPTMGALHDGHRALDPSRTIAMRCARREYLREPDTVRSDGRLSPHILARSRRDRALCREEGVDVCFEPTVPAMYPQGFQTVVTVPAIARRWEGEARPHHFTGVATVVTKLFGMVRPHIALFGQKDYQQAALVRQLVKDLNLGGRHSRPSDGQRAGWAGHEFAQCLSLDEERRVAPIFFHALEAGRQAIESGTTDAGCGPAIMRKIIERAPTIHIEYLAVCDPDVGAALRIDRLVRFSWGSPHRVGPVDR